MSIWNLEFFKSDEKILDGFLWERKHTRNKMSEWQEKQAIQKEINEPKKGGRNIGSQSQLHKIISGLML